jgi:hypothetical protein
MVGTWPLWPKLSPGQVDLHTNHVKNGSTTKCYGAGVILSELDVPAFADVVCNFVYELFKTDQVWKEPISSVCTQFFGFLGGPYLPLPLNTGMFACGFTF